MFFNIGTERILVFGELSDAFGYMAYPETHDIVFDILLNGDVTGYRYPIFDRVDLYRYFNNQYLPEHIKEIFEKWFYAMWSYGDEPSGNRIFSTHGEKKLIQDMSHRANIVFCGWRQIPTSNDFVGLFVSGTEISVYEDKEFYEQVEEILDEYYEGQ